MKKTLQLITAIIAIAGLWPYSMLAQNVHYNNAENASIYCTSTIEYILSGNTFPPTVGGMSNVGPSCTLGRIQLEKIDNALNHQWFKTYATTDEVNAVINGTCSHLDVYFKCGNAKQTSDGGYIICGSVRRDGETSGCGGSTYDDLFLLKTDAMGNVTWYKRYDKLGMLVSVVEMPGGGGYIACGYTGELGMTDQSLVIGTDASGNILWSKYGLTPAWWDHVTITNSAYYEVIPFQRNFALVGIEDIKGTLWGGTLVSVIDAFGNFLTNSIVDNENDGYSLVGRAIADANDGDVVITGIGDQPCANGGQIMLLKLDPMTMTIRYHKVYSNNNYGDYSWGDAVKVINNTIAFGGTDYTNGGAIYAEADRITGNLLTYKVFNASDAYDMKSMTVNTGTNTPVYSGTYFPGSEPTFVAENVGPSCAHDIPMPEILPPYLVYDALNIDAGVNDIKDDVIAYDMDPDESLDCGDIGSTPALKRQAPKNNITVSKKFGIAPNPAVNYIDISYNNDVITGGRIKVYNTLGALLIDKQLTDKTSMPYQLDVSTLSPGIYTIDAEWNNGTANHSPLIIK